MSISYNKFIYLLLFLFVSIKSERWWGAVNGYNLSDNDLGYAGSSRTICIDFYLCGKRKYQVHYLGDAPNLWSKNFSNCDPVGVGRPIDGICVYGKKSYKGRVTGNLKWMPIIKNCNTTKKYGYVGLLDTSLSCIAINGKDYYRMGYVEVYEEIVSSNPKNLSERIIKHFFGNKVKNDSCYNESYLLDLSVDSKNNNKLKFFNATIQLLNNEDINVNGDEIKFVFFDKSTLDCTFGKQEMNKIMLKKLKAIINFDFNEEINTFYNQMKANIQCGLLTIHSFFNESRIQMDIASKIAQDFNGYRGGIRLNLVLKNYDKLIEIIKKLILFFSWHINIGKRNQILEELKYFDNINKLGKIVEMIHPYDLLFTQIIFLYITKS